jgi:tyrosyl-tRNA synthetase
VSFGVPAQSILTMPLLVGTDGVRKMSKSFGNHIGVAEPPDEMFGKVMSIPDEALPEYYRLLLELDLDSSRRPVEAKRELARRLVDELHGEGEGALAEARFDQVHVRREVPDEVEEGGFAAGADGSVHLPALLADQFGLSRSEARRLLEQEGVRLDGTTLESGTLDVPAEALDGVILQVGKRRFKRLRLER